METLSAYVLITPARNEARFIELTIRSVVAQTVRPLKWVIVSDGSTDGTDNIVRRYAAEHPWIELMRMPNRSDRQFAGKAHAVNAAYARIRHLQFHVVGNLDGDVLLNNDHFAYLLGRLAENSALGIVGTSLREPGSPTYDYRFASDENVPGPCQLFRRECFEEIGGYAPMEHGGIDHYALISARLKGWKTKAFTERTFFHCRPMGTALASGWGTIFFEGTKDYALGNHPLWEFFRVIHRVTDPPIVLGGVLLGAGYLSATITRLSREAPYEMIDFHRREQLCRLNVLLKEFLRKRWVTEAGPKRGAIAAGVTCEHLATLTIDARSPSAASQCNFNSGSNSTGAAVGLPVYILITAARNEAQFIESTIQSIVAQTVRPLKWIIVSDGSTDGTDAIVTKYAVDHPWIELMRMLEHRTRSFGGKAHAVNAAYATVRSLDFQVLVNLDADISVSKDHFAYLLSKLAADPALGVVGTPFREASGETYDYRFVSAEHVSGACQMFRRKCFEDINGYTPLAAGGVDHLAVISARMNGWKTRTFMDRMCLHHRKTGTAENGRLKALFRVGVKDYSLGGHPLWQLSRMIYRIAHRPFLAGGLALSSGYFWAMIKRVERPIPPEIQAFHRQEQMRRLKRLFAPKPVRARRG